MATIRGGFAEFDDIKDEHAACGQNFRCSVEETLDQSVGAGMFRVVR